MKKKKKPQSDFQIYCCPSCGKVRKASFQKSYHTASSCIITSCSCGKQETKFI